VNSLLRLWVIKVGSLIRLWVILFSKSSNRCCIKFIYICVIRIGRVEKKVFVLWYSLSPKWRFVLWLLQP
jgi:hypothetical protein